MANREEVWRSVNTRITYEAVFSHYKVQLARAGVESAKDYGKIVHAENGIICLLTLDVE